MRGLAMLPFLVLGIVGVLGGSVLLSVFFPNPEDVPPADNPISILFRAWEHVPWDAVYDLFFGGILGVLVFLSTHIILPMMDWAASTAVGRHINFDPFWAHIVLSFLILLALWRKKEQIYSFLTTNIIRTGALVGAVFIIGVILTIMGVV